jgi:molybdopterin biosynthesis enzyme MoaB
MEFIRVRHGERLPSALLSRAIAGAAGRTLVYTLPGSVTAVRDYLEGILPTLHHSLLMLHGIDAH